MVAALLDRLGRGGWSDRWLLVALAAGIVLGARGMTWGEYDCLNLDRMALKKMLIKSRPPFHPGAFVKPPFYTYMNHFAAHVPASAVAGNLKWLESSERFQIYRHLRLALARSLNLALFAGCTLIVFGLVRNAWGLASARAAALVLATSAGFVPYQVFLTTDLAVVFMMLASFACAAGIAKSPGVGISVAAGLLAGLAAATKYNGLIVAAALPVAHLLADRKNPLLASLKRPAAWVCGICVPLGFLLGNPYAVLDWPLFSADFMYNYRATPVYNGVTAGTGYAAFFRAFLEILGMPGSAVVLFASAAGLVAMRWRPSKAGVSLWILSAVVFSAYTWKIGFFPRMETRFVLPAAPFAILLAAAGFPVLLRAKWLFIPVLVLVLSYNVACGWQVGSMFQQDPRMRALALFRTQIQEAATIEASKSVPRLQDLPIRDLKVVRMPNCIELSANFVQMFSGDSEMEKNMERWLAKDGPEWFAAEARAARNPDWIFWSTIDLEGVVKNHYDALFRNDSGYEVVFDETSPKFPRWSYPQHTEFIRNRLTVWMKTAPAAPCPL